MQCFSYAGLKDVNAAGGSVGHLLPPGAGSYKRGNRVTAGRFGKHGAVRERDLDISICFLSGIY